MLTPSAGQTRDAALDLIKWLAFASMLIDHLRHVWPSLYWLYIPGRLAFPFFCLAIAANLMRPSAGGGKPFPLRYLGLLALFALLSEWPYRLLVVTPHSLNVLPTLVLGLLIAGGVAQPTVQRRWLAVAALLVALLTHPWLMFGFAGALLPVAFVYALQRAGPNWVWPVLLCLAANYWPPFYIDATRGDPFAVSFILICSVAPLLGLGLLRQPSLGQVPAVRRWAYLFYPGHFLLLVGARALLI